MKTLFAFSVLFFASLVFSTASSAQEAEENSDADKTVIFPMDTMTGRVAYTRIVNVEGASASVLLRRAERFAKEDRSKFYTTSGNRNLFASSSTKGDETSMNSAEANTGYLSTDAATNTVLCRISWQFQGRTMRCVYDMNLSGDLIIRTKDSKAKVSITNITYANYSSGDRNLVKLNGFKDSGPCSSHGNLEQTVDCRVCRKPLRKMNDWMQETADVLLEKATKSLSTSIKEDKW